MNRYLKAAGLAMLAVFAIGAMAASGAQAAATVEFTASEYPADVTGSEPTENKFTIPAEGETPA